MINKQSLWFLTVFSLILVLTVYYITMPNELLIGNNSKVNVEQVNKEIDSEAEATINENELLVTMRVNLTDEREKEMKNLKSNLTNEESTSEEKNIAFEKIKYLTNLTSKEEMLENKIKKDFAIDCFVKIEEGKVAVTAVNKSHNIELANNIMKAIQKEFPEKMTITIKFEK